MATVSRYTLKQRGFKRFLNSFKYAGRGINYAVEAEQNMIIHLLAAVLVVVMGIIFNISATEWLFCIVLIGLVIGTELINSSIEAVVDLTCPERHELAAIAKNTAGGAVLVFSITAAVIGLIIFVPKILNVIL